MIALYALVIVLGIGAAALISDLLIYAFTGEHIL